MRFKIKFKCDNCGRVYYNHIQAKNRREATAYKKRFKDDNSIICWLEGGCE